MTKVDITVDVDIIDRLSIDRRLLIFGGLAVFIIAMKTIIEMSCYQCCKDGGDEICILGALIDIGMLLSAAVIGALLGTKFALIEKVKKSMSKNDNTADAQHPDNQNTNDKQDAGASGNGDTNAEQSGDGMLSAKDADPLIALKMRFANGEITAEEYERMKGILER